MGKVKLVLEKAKPFLAIMSLQFGYAGMSIIATLCLKNGMNHFILSVYRHIFATLSVAPFALLFERKTRPKMTLSVFWKIMVLGFLEPVLDQNLYYMALQYTSATFTMACVNILPAITFIMATIFRLEKVSIKKLSSQAKMIGTIVTVSGAMVMTMYRGPIVNIFGMHEFEHHVSSSNHANGQNWVLGAIFVLCSCLGWSGFFILQSFTLTEYPAELSLTAWVCFMGALEGGVVSLVAVRDMRAWVLGWDSRLVASVYTGVVCSGIAYYVQGFVNRTKGPVFVTVFSPLCMIITAVLGALFLHELLHLGSIIGAVIIVMGLYTVVWGKSKDAPPTSQAALTNENGKAQELPIVHVITASTGTKAPSPTRTINTGEIHI